jgi:transposase-like protein
LALVANPNTRLRHEPSSCAGCGADLVGAPEVGMERRQVFDLPPMTVRVIEHQLIARRCRCGATTCGTAPEGVTAPVQYGPRVTAILLYLYVGQFLSKKRTAQAVAELFGTPVSEGTLAGSVALVESKIRQAWSMRRGCRRVPALRSSFAGFRFPPDVITLAVRWYLRYGLSYRDVEELLAERGITVDHVTIYRWVQRFTPLLIDAARPCRHAPGDRWFVDETYVKIAGRWVYFYRAIDQFGQVIDVLVAETRDLAATRRFFTRALQHSPRPDEVSTDRAPTYPRVLDELLPCARHIMEQYVTNPVEADHGLLKARLRPMRGLKRLRSAQVISAGHAFVQNLRRGHYELSVDLKPNHRITAAFAELTLAI